MSKEMLYFVEFESVPEPVTLQSRRTRFLKFFCCCVQSNE